MLSKGRVCSCGSKGFSQETAEAGLESCGACPVQVTGCLFQRPQDTHEGQGQTRPTPVTHGDQGDPGDLTDGRPLPSWWRTPRCGASQPGARLGRGDRAGWGVLGTHTLLRGASHTDLLISHSAAVALLKAKPLKINKQAEFTKKLYHQLNPWIC